MLPPRSTAASARLLLGGRARPRSSARGTVERRAPARARRDRHEAARLEPPQRARGRPPRRAAARRAARAGCRSAARRRAARPCAPPTARSAACPRGGSTSESARAGVEQYSAAIHSASSTSSARQRVLAHRGRRDELLRRHLGRPGEPDHDPVERLAPERDPHDRADLDRRVRQRVVERPGQPAGGREGLDASDHGRMTLAAAAAHKEGLAPFRFRRRRPIRSPAWTGSCSATTCRCCAPSRTAARRSPTSTRRSTPGGSSRGGRSRPSRDAGGDRTGFGGRRYATRLLRAVLLPRRVRRLPRLPRAAPARGAPAARPRGHAVLPHRLPRGALLQAAARRAVRPRVLPQRADLGLRLRRQAAPPLAREARHDPRLRQGPGALPVRLPTRSTASPTWRPGS